MTGHFPEGAKVRELLAQARQRGLPFETAWELALHGAHLRRNGVPLSGRRAETAEALDFARAAFERAYAGMPETRQDLLARALLHAMERLYDRDEREIPVEELRELMEAA